MGIMGQKVIRNTDDSPCPLTGIIVGRLDEDRVEVVWGDDHTDLTAATEKEGRAEWLEDLAPRSATDRPASERFENLYNWYINDGTYCIGHDAYWPADLDKAYREARDETEGAVRAE